MLISMIKKDYEDNLDKFKNLNYVFNEFRKYIPNLNKNESQIR